MEQPDSDHWTLLALRRSQPYDPTNHRGPSRFVVHRGTEQNLWRLYDSYNQPTEIILAELRNPQGATVARFDRVAEALLRGPGAPEDLHRAIASAACKLT